MIESLGRYEIESELGQGAMGTVYKARDPLLGRVVAIKTISLHLPHDEVAEYEARFYQEAKAAGQMSHPNIVTIYDIGKSEDLAYLAMEYLEGRELREILGSGENIPIETALDIGAQVADGLHYAHDRHVVHRDIKPANVMVLDDGLIKITDFGIARMRNNEVKTMTGMILGSPKYMSPEQVSGKRADHRSDIFSLGVVVYQMLTATSPFVADNVHGVMYQTLNFNPPAPKTLNPDLPKVVDYIVAKVLAKNLEDRYQSAKDLANDLRQARAEFIGSISQAELVASFPRQPKPFVAPPCPLTRHEDAHEDGLDGGGESAAQDTLERADSATDRKEASGPILGLAGAFDSHDATMRLAAITDAERNAERAPETLQSRFLDEQAAITSSVGSQSSSIQPESVDDAPTPETGFSIDRKLGYLWIGSAVMLMAALIVVLSS